MSSNPNVLFFDIETLPMIINGVFHLGEQTIQYDQIQKESEVCCICYTFNDEKPSHLVFDMRKYRLNKRDDDADRKMIYEFKKIADTADLIVGHNGKNFDIAFLRARMVRHKIPDFIPPLIDDTYLKSKAIGFTSHKLDYLLQYLGLGEKKEHERKMWIEVQNHDKQSLDKMVTYCMGDVEGLRKVYYRLQPYIKSNLNRAFFNKTSRVCPNCGIEGTLVSRGYYRTKAGVFQQFQCSTCGNYSHLGSNIVKKSALYPR